MHVRLTRESIGGQHAPENVARRRARTRQPRVADRVLGAGLVAKGAGHLRAAGRSSTAITSASRRTSDGSARTSTSPASSCATTCWTSPASARPSTASELTEFRRANMATLAELEALIGRDDRIVEPADQAGRLLGDVRSALRLDAGRESRSQRRVPAARGGAPPRSGADHRPGDRGAEQREPRGAARGGGPAPRGVPRRPAAAALADGAPGRSSWPLIVVVRLRILERRSEEAERQMRELSQQLVNTQEEERRNLSRELHDHVAQVLTGLRMELGRIERLSANRRRPRSPSARRSSTTCSAPSATWRLGCAPACWTTSACRPRSNGTSATSCARYAINVDLRDGRRLRRAARQAPHLRLPHRAGGDDQLRPPCAGRDIRIEVAAGEGQLRSRSIDDGVGLDPASRAGGSACAASTSASRSCTAP